MRPALRLQKIFCGGQRQRSEGGEGGERRRLVSIGGNVKFGQKSLCLNSKNPVAFFFSRKSFAFQY